MSMENIEVSRVMMPDDANIAGNVHGGTILKMIEEAGVIIATRHCNQGVKRKVNDMTNEVSSVAALARIERTDFLQPMFIGEVAKVHAELSYASQHSVEVTVDVWAENLLSGVKRLTNMAHLWYVAVALQPNKEILEVPPLDGLTKEQLDEGEKRYLKQKQSRTQGRKLGESTELLYNMRPRNLLTVTGSSEVPLHSVPYSQSTLISMVNPSDCNQFGFCQGGPVMKNMDTVAGIVAYRHCRTNVVTASLDSLDFLKPTKVGHVMTFTGQLVFTSNRSMEIEVVVDAEDVVNGICYRCVSALFTFVSLGERKDVLMVPQLVLQTDNERVRFEAGRFRYETKKDERQNVYAVKRKKAEL